MDALTLSQTHTVIGYIHCFLFGFLVPSRRIVLHVVRLANRRRVPVRDSHAFGEGHQLVVLSQQNDDFQVHLTHSACNCSLDSLEYMASRGKEVLT